LEKLTKVDFTNLDKILYPKHKITKTQIIKYYIKIAPLMLKFLKNRPLVTTRFPDGVEKKGFYEKNAPKGKPTWVQTYKRYSKTSKRNIHYILANNLDTLLWLANLAALEIHIPLSTTQSPQKPDIILFDIDPEPPANIQDAIKVAKTLKKTLNDHYSLKAYPKTSGKKGLHVLVPVIPEHEYKKTKEFVHNIGKKLKKENEIVVSEFSQSQKPGTVYIDYAQNSAGRTMICPYSLRATPDATVSTPLTWKELEKGLKPQNFNISNVLERKNNPWKDFWTIKQKLDLKKT